MAQEADTLSETLRDEGISMADIIYTVRKEITIHLTDILLRRTELGTLGKPASEVVERVASWMAEELGWDSTQIAAEKEALEDAFRLEPAAGRS